MPLPDKFECAPGLRLQAHEKLADVHNRNFDRRIEKLEGQMERLEKRLWFTVYGVVAVILSQGVLGLLAVAP